MVESMLILVIISAQGTTFGLLLLLAIAISSLFMPANVEPAHLAVGNVNVQVAGDSYLGSCIKAYDVLLLVSPAAAVTSPLIDMTAFTST